METNITVLAHFLSSQITSCKLRLQYRRLVFPKIQRLILQFFTITFQSRKQPTLELQMQVSCLSDIYLIQGCIFCPIFYFHNCPQWNILKFVCFVSFVGSIKKIGHWYNCQARVQTISRSNSDASKVLSNSISLSDSGGLDLSRHYNCKYTTHHQKTFWSILEHSRTFYNIPEHSR